MMVQDPAVFRYKDVELLDTVEIEEEFFSGRPNLEEGGRPRFRRKDRRAA
jgi:hypothetical protein